MFGGGGIGFFFSFLLGSWLVVKKTGFYIAGSNTKSLDWVRQEALVSPKTYKPGNSGALSQTSAMGAKTHVRAMLDA